ncbi:MAG: protein kinase [Deltaproteobacteria bacterium]|nr:protein kinase [Deltaproteobacteria bacterium]
MHTNWEVGQTIDGKYEIFGSSSGGMGAVYFVNHLKWKIPLAVKTPLLTLINSPSAYRRYIKEAETWINIGMHPHIVSCFYVRDLDGIPRIFIEYVSGGTLKDLIDKNRFGDISYILDLAIQFSMAMEYVHDLGIIHRDIKPANCMITSDGELRVTDFGIAKLGDDVPDTDDSPHIASSYEGLTMTGTGFGTPEYMAPEQFLDAKNIGKEADIYSFGVMLYEMVCGVRPFVMPSGMNTQARDYFYRNAHFNEIPRQPIESNRRIPQSLNRIIMKCLEKDVAKRFHCFSHISSALLDCCNEAGNPNKRIKPDVLKLKADSLNNKAASFLDLGRNVDAAHCWQQALAEDPQHLEATFNYGYFKWQEGLSYRDVLKSQMANLKSNHENNIEFWRLLAWLYYEVGDIDALEEIQNSARRIIDPEFMELYNELNTPSGRWVRVFKGNDDTKGFNRLVRTVAFSPGGRYVSLGDLRGVRLWDVLNTNEIKHCKLPKTFVNSFVFSPDGKYGLAGYEYGERVILLDLASGAEIRRFEWESNQTYSFKTMIDTWDAGDDINKQTINKKLSIFNHVRSVAFSPCGTTVLAAVNTTFSGSLEWRDDEGKKSFIHRNDFPDDNIILLWDAKSGMEIQRFIGHTTDINSITFSPDGRYILSGSSQNENQDENTLKLWDVATGKDLKRFAGHNESVKSVAFCPDGKHILSAGTLTLWNLSTGKKLIRLREYGAPAVYSPDGNSILSWCHQNNYLSILDAVTGKEQRRFEGHIREVNAAMFSPNGKYILTGEWGAIRYSSIKSFPKLSDIGFYPALTRISSTAEIITESQKVQHLLATVKLLIEKINYRGAYKLLRQAQTVRGYEHDKEVLDLVNYCGIHGKGVRKELKSAWKVASFIGHSADILSVAFSPDGKYILSGSGDYFDENEIEVNNTRLWEISSGKCIRNFNSVKGYVCSVLFSHDTKYALTVGGEILDNSFDDTDSGPNLTVIAWDINTGIKLKQFNMYCDSASLSADAKYILSWGAEESTLLLWDIESGRETRQFDGHDDAISSASFLNDGKHILIGYDGHMDKTFILREIVTGNELKRFVFRGVIRNENKGMSITYSHTQVLDTNGNYIIFKGNLLEGDSKQCVRLWEIATGKEVQYFTGENGRDLRYAIFSPDGRFVATWGEDYTDDTLCLRETATGKKYKCYTGSVRSVTFSHDSKYLAFANDDKAIVLLELDWEWEFPEESR